ncbi:MAG: S8 family serine peptidase [Polyangiaceae bacterium]|nr:S8 family serine peptidase [Polyangiaceae bacterium]
MSLGTDFGPHDGSTLEEKGLTDLAGPGKVVVVAAGNPGNNAWSPKLSWGYPLHGEADLTETTTVQVPTFGAADANGTYVFFDVWYPAGNRCRIKVSTPSGATYPPAGNIRYTNSWITGTGYQEIRTNEGTIGVQNGGDVLGWGDTNADHEAYIEISNNGTKGPAVGPWTIQMVPASPGDTCQGTLHAWYGASNNIIDGWNDEAIPRVPPLLFGGSPTDNRMTIGSPATANGAIAVAAYQSRNAWHYSHGSMAGQACLPTSTLEQQYGVGQLDYYDPFELGELAYFSGRGPRRDTTATPKPEIASPGVGIASSFSHFVRQAEWGKKCDPYFDAEGKRSTGYYHYGTNRVLPGDEANILQGTSMATPTATGAIALLMQQKKNLNAACLRTLFSTSARHDAATDTYENAADGAKTDTDGAAGPELPNSDWGYGKLDVGDSSSAIAALAACTGGSACYLDVDCGDGYACKQSADPCGCGTCEAAPSPPSSTCANLGESCETKTCCKGTCGGKPGKRTCK